MTQEFINELTSENNNLKNKLQHVIQTANNQVEEINSGKEMLGEVVQQCLNLRTNLKLANKKLAEANTVKDEQKQQIESLLSISDANATRIKDLEAAIAVFTQSTTKSPQ